MLPIDRAMAAVWFTVTMTRMRHADVRDRKDAGERLAAQLLHLKDKSPVVLALPRGGCDRAEIARLLGAPLDIVLVRKIGVPWQPELALGAVADGGTPEIFIDERMAESLMIPAITCARNPRASWPSSNAGARPIARADRRSTSAAAPRSSSMTGSLPARRCGSPCAPYGDRARLAGPRRAGRRRRDARRLAGEADETVCVTAPRGLGAIAITTTISTR